MDQFLFCFHTHNGSEHKLKEKNTWCTNQWLCHIVQVGKEESEILAVLCWWSPLKAPLRAWRGFVHTLSFRKRKQHQRVDPRWVHLNAGANIHQTTETKGSKRGDRRWWSAQNPEKLNELSHNNPVVQASCILHQPGNHWQQVGCVKPTWLMLHFSLLLVRLHNPLCFVFFFSFVWHPEVSTMYSGSTTNWFLR